MLWLKPISPPDFAAELEKGLVLTWFSFSKFNFLPCFVTPETEAPLFFFLGNESQLNLLGARSGPARPGFFCGFLLRFSCAFGSVTVPPWVSISSCENGDHNTAYAWSYPDD